MAKILRLATVTIIGSSVSGHNSFDHVPGSLRSAVYAPQVSSAVIDRSQIKTRDVRPPSKGNDILSASGALAQVTATSEPLETTQGLMTSESQETEQPAIPVGGWVGIGFGILLVLLVALYFIVGQRKVTEYFVRVIRDRIQRRDKFSTRQADQETLDSLEVRCSSKSENRHGSKYGSSIGHNETNSGTPRTINDIPIAPIEIEPDGRMSPKLPIPSRRISSVHAETSP